jgi:hypothetical protein
MDSKKNKNIILFATVFAVMFFSNASAFETNNSNLDNNLYR